MNKSSLKHIDCTFTYSGDVSDLANNLACARAYIECKTIEQYKIEYKYHDQEKELMNTCWKECKRLYTTFISLGFTDEIIISMTDNDY